MEFKIDDQVCDMLDLPAAVARARAVLEDLDDGQLLTTQGLAARIDMKYSSFMLHASHPALEDYKEITTLGGTRKSVFGNRATIEAYRGRHG